MLVDSFRALIDSFFVILKPIIEKIDPQKHTGRPRTDTYKVLYTICHKVRDGIAWRMIEESEHFVKGTTAHSTYQKWIKLGVFNYLCHTSQNLYEILVGYNLDWQSVDGTIIQAPVRGSHKNTESRGRNPTDRGRQGSKVSAISDRAGMPLGFVLTSANIHDSKILESTILDAVRNGRYENYGSLTMHLCLDMAYDGKPSEETAFMYGFQAHIQSRYDEKMDKCNQKHKPKRWVIERLFAHLKGWHGCRTRYTIKEKNFIGDLKLACTGITLHRMMTKGVLNYINEIINAEIISTLIEKYKQWNDRASKIENEFQLV